MRDEYTDPFWFIKESRSLKLWCHWLAFPGLFSNTLEHIRVSFTHTALSLLQRYSLAAASQPWETQVDLPFTYRAEILWALERTRRNPQILAW